jgi:hypothetical protein
MRLLTLVIAVSVAAAAGGAAHASLFFLFSRTHAAHRDEVVIRTGGTPPSFDLADRVRPFQAPITVYLVPEAVAASVRSHTDLRLVLAGTLVPDKNGHGVLKFRVPQLHTGTYAVAAWCPGCAADSFGRRFFTFPDDPQIVRATGRSCSFGSAVTAAHPGGGSSLPSPSSLLHSACSSCEGALGLIWSPLGKGCTRLPTSGKSGLRTAKSGPLVRRHS